jgi:hypothetical protein
MFIFMENDSDYLYTLVFIPIHLAFFPVWLFAVKFSTIAYLSHYRCLPRATSDFLIDLHLEKQTEGFLLQFHTYFELYENDY